MHIRCNGISVDEYVERQKRNRDNPELEANELWSCMKCVVDDRSDFVPFIESSNFELNNINSVDSMKLFELLPSDEVHFDALYTNQLLDDDFENNIESINCKYYTCEQFFNMDSDKSFNLFHSNVNGYLGKADNILEFLSTDSSNTDFDVICISETSMTDGVEIPNNAKITGYNEPFSTNTLSSKGGVTIFAKNPNVIERTDLKIQNVEFEGVWIEINNPRSKNRIIGCLYRHPHYNNIENFSEYVSECVTKLSKENKEVYIAGDFNIDLLKYETNPKYREFYNFMTSYGYLPLITQPTRFSEDNQSLIDNIFTIFN